MASTFIDSEVIHHLEEHMDQVINGLPSPIRDRIKEFILSTKGKMLRPSIIALVTKILTDGLENEKAMNTAYNNAVAVELLHNMTLIHDDLIDGAPIRRGKSSYHIRYGNELALHDGDILHAYSLTIIDHIPSLKLVLRVAYDVGIGNAIELEDRLSHNFDFNIEHVIEIMRKKTAIVFAGCVQLGYYAAGRDKELPIELKEAIINGGIAFQIQDDYLDVMGDSVKFGKKQLWDVQESKRNLFLYFALQTEHAERIKEIYDKPVGEKTEDDIKFVLQVFREVAPKVKGIRDEYVEKALEALEELEDETEDERELDLLDFLTTIIEYLAFREK